MFSQYNIEKQSWARQQDLNRNSRSYFAPAVPSQAPQGRIASAKPRLVVFLATVTPAVALLVLAAVR